MPHSSILRARRQFYERTCINEQMKMQRNVPPAQAFEIAKRMSGVEYQLHHAQQVGVQPS